MLLQMFNSTEVSPSQMSRWTYSLTMTYASNRFMEKYIHKRGSGYCSLPHAWDIGQGNYCMFGYVCRHTNNSVFKKVASELALREKETANIIRLWAFLMQYARSFLFVATTTQKLSVSIGSPFKSRFKASQIKYNFEEDFSPAHSDS